MLNTQLKVLYRPLKRLFQPRSHKVLATSLLVVFIGGVLVSGLILERVLHSTVQSAMSSKAYTLLSTMNAVRDYTNSEITPQFEEQISEEFVPASVPSYSAQQVFEKLRKQDTDYRKFLYKEAALNPTSLRDKATPFEESIIQQFKEDRTMHLTGFWTNEHSEKFFYMALPSTVSAPSCLNCHSTPDIAPASMIERYGAENGFGWQLNEVIGARLIYLPAQQIAEGTYASLPPAIAAIAGVLAIALGTVYIRLKSIQP